MNNESVWLRSPDLTFSPLSSSERLRRAAESAKSDGHKHIPPQADWLDGVIDLVKPLRGERVGLGGEGKQANGVVEAIPGGVLHARVQGGIHTHHGARKAAPGKGDYLSRRHHRKAAEDCRGRPQAIPVQSRPLPVSLPADRCIHQMGRGNFAAAPNVSGHLLWTITGEHHPL